MGESFFGDMLVFYTQSENSTLRSKVPPTLTRLRSSDVGGSLEGLTSVSKPEKSAQGFNDDATVLQDSKLRGHTSVGRPNLPHLVQV